MTKRTDYKDKDIRRSKELLITVRDNISRYKDEIKKLRNIHGRQNKSRDKEEAGKPKVDPQ